MMNDRFVTIWNYAETTPKFGMYEWFYELIFYKKNRRAVTDDDSTLYRNPYNRVNKPAVNVFKCGPKRKLKLLEEYGDIRVRFMSDDDKEYKGISMSVRDILTVYGWQTILNRVKYIMDEVTGELIFYRK